MCLCYKTKMSENLCIIIDVIILLYYPWDLVCYACLQARTIRLAIGHHQSIVVVLMPVTATVKDLSGRHCFYTYAIFLCKQEIINYIPFEHIYLAAVTRSLWSGSHIRLGYARLLGHMEVRHSLLYFWYCV